MDSTSSYILILELDPVLSRSLADLFHGEGFETKEETESGHALARIMEKDPAATFIAEDIVNLGDMEFLPLLRRLTDGLIVVMGEGSEISVVTSLMQGADLYMKKPINFREFLTRVRSMLRRTGSDISDANYQFYFPMTSAVWRNPLSALSKSAIVRSAYLSVKRAVENLILRKQKRLVAGKYLA